jgi:hypothetical protein
MDPTECHLDEHGNPHCALCGGRSVETSRHPSHVVFRQGTQVAVDRVWGRCEQCNASGWWRIERQRIAPGA